MDPLSPPAPPTASVRYMLSVAENPIWLYLLWVRGALERESSEKTLGFEEDSRRI